MNPTEQPRLGWIELLVGFACNCRCLVCPGSYLPAPPAAMTNHELAAGLVAGRRRGATGVWFGGGEPTLHPGLIAAVARAREIGYERVLVQSNALRFADPRYTQRMIAAGAHEFAVPVMGADAESHNAITQHPRSWDLLLAGARNLIDQGARVRGDVLITTRNVSGLAKIVDRFADLGLSGFTFWLLSTHGLATSFEPWLPDLLAVVPTLQDAFDRAEARGVPATSWHTPPCVLDPPYRSRYQPCLGLDLLVVPPGGQPFHAEESPMEGGAYLEGCTRCASRPGCLGPRADYLRLRGAAPFRPLT